MSEKTDLDITIEDKFKPHILKTPISRVDKSKIPSPENVTDY